MAGTWLKFRLCNRKRAVLSILNRGLLLWTWTICRKRSSLPFTGLQLRKCWLISISGYFCAYLRLVKVFILLILIIYLKFSWHYFELFVKFFQSFLTFSKNFHLRPQKNIWKYVFLKIKQTFFKFLQNFFLEFFSRVFPKFSINFYRNFH